MLELHGWITFRETYEAVEDCQFDRIMEAIFRKCESLKYHTIEAGSHGRRVGILR